MIDRERFNSRDYKVFPDPVIANATIDRIFDRAATIIFKGDSYRLKGRISTRDLSWVDEKGISH